MNVSFIRTPQVSFAFGSIGGSFAFFLSLGVSFIFFSFPFSGLRSVHVLPSCAVVAFLSTSKLERGSDQQCKKQDDVGNKYQLMIIRVNLKFVFEY